MADNQVTRATLFAIAIRVRVHARYIEVRVQNDRQLPN